MITRISTLLLLCFAFTGFASAQQLRFLGPDRTKWNDILYFDVKFRPGQLSDFVAVSDAGIAFYYERTWNYSLPSEPHVPAGFVNTIYTMARFSLFDDSTVFMSAIHATNMGGGYEPATGAYTLPNYQSIMNPHRQFWDWFGLHEPSFFIGDTAIVYRFGNMPEVPSGGVLKSIDNGKTWIGTNLWAGYFHHPSRSPLIRHRVQTGAWDRTQFRFFSSDDDISWDSLGVITHRNFDDYQFIALGDTVVLGTSAQADTSKVHCGVYQSIDGGRNWTMTMTGKSIISIAYDPAHRSRVYAATQDSIFRSVDAGRSWMPIFVMPFSKITGIIKHWYGDTIFIATRDTGLYALAEMPVEVTAAPTHMNFFLDQNYPNPVAGSGVTVIRYGIPLQASIDLSLYDILGRRVKTLTHGSINAGEHSITLDVNDLPSGLYFYRLAGDGNVSTRLLYRVK